MSRSTDLPEEYRNLSNTELLERVAALDPDQYPVAERAQNCLDQFEDELSE